MDRGAGWRGVLEENQRFAGMGPLQIQHPGRAHRCTRDRIYVVTSSAAPGAAVCFSLVQRHPMTCAARHVSVCATQLWSTTCLHPSAVAAPPATRSHHAPACTPSTPSARAPHVRPSHLNTSSLPSHMPVTPASNNKQPPLQFFVHTKHPSLVLQW